MPKKDEQSEEPKVVLFLAKKRTRPEDPYEFTELNILDMPADADAVKRLREMGCKVTFRFGKPCEITWPLGDLWPPAGMFDSPGESHMKDYDTGYDNDD